MANLTAVRHLLLEAGLVQGHAERLGHRVQRRLTLPRGENRERGDVMTHGELNGPGSTPTLGWAGDRLKPSTSAEGPAEGDRTTERSGLEALDPEPIVPRAQG